MKNTWNTSPWIYSRLPYSEGGGPQKGSRGGAAYWVFAAFLVLATALFPALLALHWLALGLGAIWAFWKRRTEAIWMAMAMTPGLEVWSRMQDQVFLPYEIGKYSLAFFLFLLVLNQWQRGGASPAYSAGFWILLLLLPSLWVALPQFQFGDWVFNALGILELGLGLWLMARQRWNPDTWFACLRAALWPLVGVLVYLSIHNPLDLELKFGLGASVDLTDGFGPNQVSTILGLGLFLTTVLLVARRPFFPLVWMNYVLAAWFLVRGMLSFSRGGMVMAVVAILCLSVPYFFSRRGPLWSRFLRLGLVSVLAIGAVVQINTWTGNALWLRYMGETPGTLAGTREKDWRVMTSGRTEIIRTDWAMFLDHPLWGMGPGQSMPHRPRYGYPVAASHTEFSRLWAEHGLGGVAVSLILIGFAFYWFRRQKHPGLAWILAGFFLLSLGSSLHSAMRTNITPILYWLAAVPLYRYRMEGRRADKEPAKGEDES